MPDPTTARSVLVYRSLLGAPSEPWLFTQHRDVPGWGTTYLTHQIDAEGDFVHEWARSRVVASAWGTSVMRRAAFSRGHDPVANRAIDRIEPRLLHAHFGPDGAFALRTADRHRLPLVVSFHGYDAVRPDSTFTTRGGRFWLRHRAELFGRASLLLANSEFVRSHLIALGAESDKVRVQRIGVDLAQYSATGPRPDANVLFVGRLASVKGIDIAVRAMSLVTKQLPTARFTVVGDGPLRPDMEALARDLGIEVHWTGALPIERVRQELARATIVLAPSNVSPDGQREALGLSLVEAQACGIPVVASRSGGIPETVLDGVTGLLAAEGSVEETAEHVLRLLRDPDLRHRLGEAGRGHVSRDFDLPEQSRRLARFYDDVCGAEGN
ncbi:MAG: glycosyl transferase family 1 [Acidimicrobiales bacterium mtb01]|nr:glycosyltransferase [Actinomycetota bacterium]TEX45524.1 MAG: glycosyl transferase family 1 [Acidimicrobiales bacterium mtb01]